jgi:Formyl transferase
VAARTVGRAFIEAWSRMLARYVREWDDFPDLPRIEVADVNDPPVLGAVQELAPDLVAVSGTNLVGSAVIEASARGGGIVNLHTGISPQVKGGPNCTNWCLARGWFDLIGNTVMWLDAGIDSGNLIATERTRLTGDEDLAELHWKVMEHAHGLYARAIGAIGAGRPVPDVPQDEVGRGPTFRSRLDGAADVESALELQASLREGGGRRPRIPRAPRRPRGCPQDWVIACLPRGAGIQSMVSRWSSHPRWHRARGRAGRSAPRAALGRSRNGLEALRAFPR